MQEESRGILNAFTRGPALHSMSRVMHQVPGLGSSDESRSSTCSDSDNEAVIVVHESPSVPGPVTLFPDEHDVESDDDMPLFQLPAAVEHSTRPADLTSIRGHPVESSDVPGDDIRAGVADPKILRDRRRTQVNGAGCKERQGHSRGQGLETTTCREEEDVSVSPSAGTRPMKIGEKAPRVTAMGDRKLPGGTTDSAHDQNKKSRKRQADRVQVGCIKGAQRL